MTSFNKIVPRLESMTGSDWRLFGAHTKPIDTRSTKQLLDNIECFAKQNEEVAKFKRELKSMNPEHLGLVSDICEIANFNTGLPSNINIRKIFSNGQNLFEALLERLPKASKENPESIKFAQEVLNQTDMNVSKYFLASFIDMFGIPQASKHLAAARPLIKDVAEQTLVHGCTRAIDHNDEVAFSRAIFDIISPASDPQKISVIEKLTNIADKVKAECTIDIVDIIPFIQGSTPMAKIAENLQILPKIAEMAPEKAQINMTDFLMRNVNLD